MARPKSIITKSQLAKELQLSKARISQLIREGLPTRPDGKVNRDAAADWYHKNISERPVKTAPRKVARPVSAEADLREIQHQARLETVQAICNVTEALQFAQAMLLAGVSPEVAFVAGQLHVSYSGLAADSRGWLTDRELETMGCDPSNEEWRTVLGDFDLSAADALLDRATREYMDRATISENADASPDTLIAEILTDPALART